MSPLSIGFPYVADRFGGSNASSLVLARALSEAGHRVHVLTHGGDGRVADEAASLALPVTRLPALSGTPGYARPDRFRVEQLMAFGAARRAMRQLSLDIVHTNDLTMLRAWAMPALAGRVPLVAHWRSNYRNSWSIRAGLGAAARVIAVSGYSFDRLPDWVRRKGMVEFNAFGLHMAPAQRLATRAGLRERLGLPPDAAIVGVFGNHIVRKRTHVLADVLARIATTADGRPVFGLACGGRAEPYDNELDQKIGRYRLEGRLLRPGFVRPVEDWMAGCDVILAPAIDEPLARNVLEAMALEIPAVVSTDGGLPELVRDGVNGLLRDPRDIPGWIAATRKILDEPVFAAKLAAAGRATIADLTPDRHAARVEAVYRSIPAIPESRRMSLHDNVLSYLRRQAPDALGFWIVADSTARPTVLAACDTFYSLKLIGGLEMLAPDAAIRFARLLGEHRLAGGIGHGQGNPLGVHKTAYALGVLNFLDAHGQPVQQDALRENGWRRSELLDHRHRPRWPWYFTHHAWRVGHWIGGIPAIMLSLWRLAPRLAAQNRFPPPEIVLGSSDTLIDRDTGLFRAYRLEPAQRAFRALYRMRHDPDMGDLGGIAHLHWGNYAAGRLPYKAAPALFDRTWALLDQRRPFMERVPYCLDFDVLHLARTATPMTIAGHRR